MLASKFRGCLIGSLVGDCLGAPFEGDFPVSKSLLKKYFSNVRDQPKAGSVQMLPYTDDTAMTFSVAKSLIEKKKLDPNDLSRKFVDEYFKSPKRGYGMNVVDVFDALKKIEFVDVFLPAKQQFNGTGSYGNGAAMRIAPVALFAHNKGEELTKEMVEGCSLITHTHQNGYNGALLQCFAIQEALKMDSKQEINPVKFISDLQNKFEKIEVEQTVSSLESKRPYCEALGKISKIFTESQQNMSADEVAVYLGNSVRAHESVPTAIYSFLRSFFPLSTFESSNAFDRTLYFAISIGGDTDTIASMACSIAGAYLGEESISEALKQRCEAVQQSIQHADQIYDLNKA